MDKEIKPFEFGIIRILDCGFFIEESVPHELSMGIGYGLNFAYDIENNWVQFNIKAEFRMSQSELILISGTVLTRFAVPNIKGYSDENSIIEFPFGSLESLFSISFGHMRAILAKNISGSRFSNLIVPVINPQSLFKELFEDNVEKFKEFAFSSGIDIEGKKAIELFEVNALKALLKE